MSVWSQISKFTLSAQIALSKEAISDEDEVRYGAAMAAKKEVKEKHLKCITPVKEGSNANIYFYIRYKH